MATIRPLRGRWQAMVRRKGMAPRAKSFDKKSTAERWARELEAELDRCGVLPDTRVAESMTLSQLLTRYRDEVSPKKRSAISEMARINGILRRPICYRTLTEAYLLPHRAPLQAAVDDRFFIATAIAPDAPTRAINNEAGGGDRPALCSATSFAKCLAARLSPNEAQTEDDLVYPLLEEIGWQERDVQPNASVKARLDVPDALLYPDMDAKAYAGGLEPWARFQHGLCIVEAKRWGRPLDREERGRNGEGGTPSSQIMRYLRRVKSARAGHCDGAF